MLLLAFKEHLCVVFLMLFSFDLYFFSFFYLFYLIGFFCLLHSVFQRALANTRAIKARAGKEHSVVFITAPAVLAGC